jgi:hypothetical protein
MFGSMSGMQETEGIVVKDLLFFGRRKTHPADCGDGFFEGEQRKVGAIDELADADLADDPPDLVSKRGVSTHYRRYGRNVHPDIILIPRISFPGLNREQLLEVNETHVSENELSIGMIDGQHYELPQFIGVFGVDSGPWYPPVPFYGNPSFRSIPPAKCIFALLCC